MLSQATIDRIANELLEQARNSKFGFMDPSGMPVTPLYRCRDLQALPQGLQQEIVYRATREAGSNIWFMPLMFGAIAAVIMAFFFLYVLAPAPSGTRVLPFILPAMAPLLPMLFRTVLTRTAVRRIAARVAASWPIPAHL